MRKKIVTKSILSVMLIVLVFACTTQTVPVQNTQAAPTEPPEVAILAFENGNELYHLGLYEEAVKMFSEAIRLHPDYPEALHNRGLIYFYTGDFDRALTDFNAALGLKPNTANFLISRGGTYFGKHDFEKALVDYETALRLEPNNAEALFHRGVLYIGMGDYNRAVNDLEAALRIEPDQSDTRELLELARGLRDY